MKILKLIFCDKKKTHSEKVFPLWPDQAVAKGLNQIATVFNPHYDQYVNVDGYDRIARYFANEHDF